MTTSSWPASTHRSTSRPMASASSWSDGYRSTRHRLVRSSSPRTGSPSCAGSTAAVDMDAMKQLAAALSDRYAIDREIGAGGMATVYLARDLKHNRKVALKVLRPELAAMVGPERFLSEIQVTANLQHPHLLPLFESGEADGLLYYVMPFVEGESLRSRMDRERQLP